MALSKFMWSILIVMLVLGVGYWTVSPAEAATTFNVTDAASLIQAIENANDETNNPGSDIIDLGGNVIMPSNIYADYGGATAFPQITSNITVQNGSIDNGTISARVFFVTVDGALTLENMVISNAGTSSIDGGVILADGNVTIVDSTLNNNTGRSGGVLELNGWQTNFTPTVEIRGSQLAGNSASQDGGAINIKEGLLTIVNSVLSGNLAADGGGAITYLGPNLRIVNSTLAGNSAEPWNSGAIDGENITIENSILWDNGSSVGISSSTLSTDNYTYTTIPAIFDGVGSTNQYPRFVAPVSYTNAPTTAGDYRLTALSPAIDAGSNTVANSLNISSTDVDGNNRFSDDTGISDRGEGSAPIIDMGAYEFQGTSSCTGYSYPYTVTGGAEDLTGAILCANVNTTADTIDLNGNTVTLATSYGNIEYNNDDGLPQIASELTLQNGTLDGNQQSFRLLRVNTVGDLTLDNVTLQNAGQTTLRIGGIGVQNEGLLMMRDSIITANAADSNGTALRNLGIATIQNSLIAGNYGTSVGSALYNDDQLTIINSTIAGNSGNRESIWNARGDLTIHNSVLWGNSGGISGLNERSREVTYSIIQGGANGTGNLNTAPSFANPRPYTEAPTADGDYQLSELSAAIDAASNSVASAAVIGNVDLAGNSRYLDDTGIDDSGEGSAPIIDMGAYEFTGTSEKCATFTSPYVVDGTATDLREAIICANANSQADIIDLNGQTITPVTPYADYNGLTAFPEIYTELTLRNGTLDGGLNDFRLLNITNTGVVRMRNMRLHNSGGTQYEYGGAVQNAGFLQLDDSIVAGNLVYRFGGAMYNTGRLNVHNSVFSGNKASFGASAIYTYGGVLKIVNSTIAGNTSIAIVNNRLGDFSDGTVTVINSIIWGNENGLGSVNTIPTIVNSLIQNGQTTLLADPNFVNPQPHTAAPTTAGDYRLGETSPAIDAGDNVAAADATIGATDLLGNPRYADDSGMVDRGTGTAPIIDMGAYEFQGTTDCTAYPFPYTVTGGVTDLKGAIACANASGMANTIDLNGATLTLTTPHGNYVGPTNLPTIISDITIRNGTLDGAYNDARLFYVDILGYLRLENMTLINGGGTNFTYEGAGIHSRGQVTINDSSLTDHTTLIGSTTSYDGGAIYNNGTLTIARSTFARNRAYLGSSILNEFGTVNIVDTTFTDHSTGLSVLDNRWGDATVTTSTFTENITRAINNAGSADRGSLTVEDSTFSNEVISGGTLVYNGATATIQDSTFNGNPATDHHTVGIFNSREMTILGSTFTNLSSAASGSAIGNSNSLTIEHSRFLGNFAEDDGGVARNTGSITVYSSLFAGNAATNGGVFDNYGTVNAYTSTFAGNRATNAGGVAYNRGSINMVNSILWNNSSLVQDYLNGKTNIRTSIVQGDYTGDGVLNLDARFVDPRPPADAPTTIGDYHLQDTSPAINLGDNTAVNVATDLDGNPRIQGGWVDMGAYETDVPGVEITFAPAQADEAITPDLVQVNVVGGQSTPRELTADISITADTANPDDYTLNNDPITVVIPANTADGTKLSLAPDFTVNDDAIVENDETLRFTASGMDIRYTQPPFTYTILNDDAAGITLDDSDLQTALPEGDTTLTRSLAVILDAPAQGDVVVPINTNGQCDIQEAVSSTDMRQTTAPASSFATNLNVTVPAGETEAILIVRAVNDTEAEAASVPCVITAGDPTSPIAAYDNLTAADVAEVAVNTLDNDVAFTVASSGDGNEGTDAPQSYTFTVTPSGAIANVEGSVDIAFSGSAVLGTDYTFDAATDVTGAGVSISDTTLTFTAGAASATVTVQTIPDYILEPDKQLSLTLSNPTVADNGTASITVEVATIVLTDDEPNPKVDLNRDEIVSPVDVIYVVNRIGTDDLSADVDGDGNIDDADATLVQEALGQ